jgi:CRP-like cAMP-binding protein
MDESNGAQHFAHFGAGDMIFSEGDSGAEMYIIQEGQVEIVKDFSGNLTRIAVLEEGDFFGEMSILEDIPRSAGARALNKTVLLRMDRQTFDQMTRHNPEIPIRMLRKLCRRLREADPLLLDVEADAVISVRKQVGVAPSGVQAKAVDHEVVDQAGVHAKLVHEASGTEFHLSTGPETLIGRYDASTGISPDIDLRQVDTEHSISRRHAKILRRDHTFVILEEVGSTNGTFLNRKRVGAGKEAELKDGDHVQFGLVKTIFRSA